MLTSRFTTVSVLALKMSVCVCLLAAANVQALAQQSAAVVAVQAQAKKGLKPAVVGSPVAAQVECPAEEATEQSHALYSHDERKISHAPLLRETFCALLSKYLSLS